MENIDISATKNQRNADKPDKRPHEGGIHPVQPTNNPCSADRNPAETILFRRFLFALRKGPPDSDRRPDDGS